MILLSILSVIGHLIRGNNLNCLLNLNLIYETLWTGVRLKLKKTKTIAKTASKKIGALLRLLCISINLPFANVWNTVVTSGLVPPVATWNC